MGIRLTLGTGSLSPGLALPDPPTSPSPQAAPAILSIHGPPGSARLLPSVALAGPVPRALSDPPLWVTLQGTRHPQV